jgi:hypothetical protein
MRIIDVNQGRIHRHFAKKYGCRAWLRLPLAPSWFLAGWRHRPRMCNHNIAPWGRAGEGP